ncbi:MAG: type II toxin-antitoxin system RelE/ParE family toxin [Nitrospirae bacterium]|nr:type II toxin-antitoxin system RelE/ParE family toxin [Nitrospirota bacterium]
MPASLSRNRKILINLVPPWDAVPPVWELRVKQYRVFYDVDEAKKIVYVRAVREKPTNKTTEEIL